MAFDIRLVQNIEAVQVAQFVPARIVRIVAGTDRVEIGLLDHADVSLHPVERERPAPPGIVLMAVHAVEAERFAVEQERPGTDFKGGETGAVGAHVENRFAALQDHPDRIEHRQLGAPQLDGGQRDLRDFIRRNRHGEVAVARSAHAQLDRQPGGIAAVHDFGPDGFRGGGSCQPHIGQILPLGRIKRHIAENAGKSPEILILQIAAAAILVHFDRDQVFTGPDETGHVEFGRTHRIFAVTGESAVHPDPERALHRAEVKHQTLAAPLRRQRETAAAAPGRIAFDERGPVGGRLAHHMRRVAVERIGVIGVNRRAVSGALEIGGQRDFVPAGIVELRRGETVAVLRQGRRPAEFPEAIQVEAAVVEVEQQLSRGDFELPGRPRGAARRQFIHSDHRRIFKQREQREHVRYSGIELKVHVVHIICRCPASFSSGTPAEIKVFQSICPCQIPCPKVVTNRQVGLDGSKVIV